MEPDKQGMIYLCATPIGNLEDVTLRVLRILKEADTVAAEDTRHTRKLLSHYDIHTPLVSLHEHNESERIPSLIEEAQSGKLIAVVTDAGMPGISDPGTAICRAAREAGVPVTVAPGPSAVLSALVFSGLDGERFVFEGFLPRANAEKRERLASIAAEERTVILYEAPHRVEKTLKALCDACGGDRQVSVVREITKVHEEVWSGTLGEAAARAGGEEGFRGELVLVLAGAQVQETEWEMDIPDQLRRYIREGMDKKEAVKRVARERGLPKSEVYKHSIDL
jgi:16S rRNA (cytidine1402-2'-O)-methyltransferase